MARRLVAGLRAIHPSLDIDSRAGSDLTRQRLDYTKKAQSPADEEMELGLVDALRL